MPEARNGGPIALVKDGDRIVIDAVERILHWDVSDEEQMQRRKQWETTDNMHSKERRGVLFRYARDVAVRVLFLSQIYLLISV